MIPNPEENIWEHSQNVRELYSIRAHSLEEMDSSAQCAEILAPFLQAAPAPLRLLDAGCGSGYLWQSFRKRGLELEYYGLDYSPGLIEIGRRILPEYGLPPERLKCGRIEDLCGQRYDLAALLNTLTFCPDFREPLDRLLGTGISVLLIRDNFGPETVIRWEEDGFLDPGYNHLKAYWNRWNVWEVIHFLGEYGFRVEALEDKRCRGQKELVVGKPYYWSWLLASKKTKDAA